MKLDVIFENALFRTVDDARPTARRAGVWRGRIAALDDDLDGVTAHRVVDLGGATVVPGFHDAHQHFSMVGREKLQLDLSVSVAPTLEALLDAVAERVGRVPAGAWVIGNGYDQNKIGVHPTAQQLDRIAPEHPVWLVHTSKHMAVANSAAARAAGFTGLDALPDVPGGTVVRDRGVPTGLLQETAMNPVSAVLFPVPLPQMAQALAAASEHCLAEGITSVTEPGIGGVGGLGSTRADLRAFQDARDSGLLRVRATVMPYIEALHDFGPIGGGENGFGLDLGLRSGLGDDWVRVGGVKIVSDGSLIGRTAAMCCDYHDAPGERGYLRVDAGDLRSQIVGAHRNGWQVATHAIGDAALDVVLDAYAEAQRSFPRADTRHRIEHCAVASPGQVRRIVELGLIPVPQGRFVSEIGDGLLAAMGPERAAGLYRMRTWVDAGVELPGSSDAPVVDSPPLWGLHDMVNRRTASGAPFVPSEALTAAQALRAYTHGSAYATHQEHVKGRIVPGLLADLAVLDRDPVAVAAEEIRDLRVLGTIVGGEIAYQV
ncbi:amidohydrolase [Actinoplanes couchii]|uniref:Amidohydrolase n=1 Tax=Actinoplanes couchii TaxID=403638 RepID=A0ABQ3XGH0_9ACTN|nr:amidohydrolase [Actinoplanes couchii]MDR6321062.1 putative amidohydrolase YtcJ [Actinoplanes couchii]GID57573.1 amidohydrolase [Actinoplanes couchii]